MSVSTTLSIKDKMTAKLNKIAQATSKVNQTLRTTNTLSETSTIGKSYDRVSRFVNKSAQEIVNFQNNQKNAAGGAEKIKSVWGGVGSIIRSAAAAFGAKKIIELSDDMTLTTARLDLINDGLQTTVELQDKIMASANRTRASYSDVAGVVSRLGILAKDAFSSNDEIIAFTELMNKNFVVGGASSTEQSAAMYQLTQAMASGKLQGDEFRSIMENAPLLAQAIADFTGKSTAELKEMSSQGLITAEVIKGAMFASADDINAKFAKMPMTWSQLWTVAKNAALQAFQPLINAIGAGAQWVYDNWSTIAPIFWGLAAAVGVLTLAYGAWQLATWMQTIAQWALNHALLASGIGAIAVAIGLIIVAFVKWAQTVGGFQAAWLICVDNVLYWWDMLGWGIHVGWYWISDMIGGMQYGFAEMGVNIGNTVDDMGASVMEGLQWMVNGAIDILNNFIGTLNHIPGVNIGFIDQVTFGTEARLGAEANKQARAAGLEAYGAELDAAKAQRKTALDNMLNSAEANHAARQAEIAQVQAEAAAKSAKETMDWSQYGNDVGTVDTVNNVKGEVSISEEDLKFLRDVAEMRFIQNFVTLTPTVAVDAKISEKVDLDEVIYRFEDAMESEIVSAAEGVYAI